MGSTLVCKFDRASARRLSPSGIENCHREENLMDRKPITVSGIFPTQAGIENAVEAFRDAGFQSTRISILLPEKMSMEDLGFEGATNPYEEATPLATGIVAIDGPLGWLHEVGPATIPGEGNFIVAGPIAETLEYVALEGVAGGLATALIRVGIPEGETGEYTAKIMQGGALLSVQCDDAEEAEVARQLQSDTGGTNIFLAGQPKTDFKKVKRSMPHWAGR
jgi:hypothetical protein